MAGIAGYSGIHRSGKSHSVTEYVILPALKEHRTVYTNIPMVNEQLEADGYGTPISFELNDIKQNPEWFHELEKGCVLVIDEFQNLYASGTQASKLPEQHKEFFTQFSHMVGENGKTTELVVISQDLGNICNFVRQLIAYTYRTTKLDVIGQANRYKVDIYQGPVTGPSPPESKKIDTRRGKYKPEVYQYYKSSTMSDIGTVGDEENTDSRKTINVKKLLITYSIGLALLVTFAIWAFGNVFSEYREPETTEQKTVSSTPVAHTEIQPSPEPNPFAGYRFVITYNNGNYPRIDYRIKAFKGSSYVELDIHQLRRIGFYVFPHDQCLVELGWYERTHFALCEEESTRDFSFGEQVSEVL